MEQLDLTGVTQFLEERDLVLEKYCRYYLHWIRRFLMDPRASSPALSEEDCLRVFVQGLTQTISIGRTKVTIKLSASCAYVTSVDSTAGILCGIGCGGVFQADLAAGGELAVRLGTSSPLLL